MSKYDIDNFKDISTTDGNLSLFGYVNMSYSHGPGRRFAIWTQGCFKRCPGCINPQMQDAASHKKFVSPEELVQKIVDVKNSVLDIEGITIQGGEPFLQAENLAKFIQLLKEKAPELNILVFSGYTLSELRDLNSPHVDSVLSNIDALIDGVFEADQFDNERVAGSINQRIHHLGEHRLENSDFGRQGGDVIVKPTELKFIRTGVPKK